MYFYFVDNMRYLSLASGFWMWKHHPEILAIAKSCGYGGRDMAKVVDLFVFMSECQSFCPILDQSAIKWIGSIG